MTEHPAYDRRNDTRVSIFSKCINCLDALLLGFIFYDHHLTEDKWWNQVSEKLQWNPPPLDDRLQWVDNFATFLKIGFIQTLVSSAIESSVRTIAVCIDQTVCETNGISFKSLYHWMLSELNLSQHESLLDILRCIRNANHDNGSYYGPGEDVQYGGLLYHFENERPVNFVTWDLLFNISSDLVNAIYDIVNSNRVSSKESIEDRSLFL